MRKELEKEMDSWEMEIKSLHLLADEAVRAEKNMKETNKSHEGKLTAGLQNRVLELETLRTDRVRAEEEAAKLETKVRTVAEKEEAAEFGLEETQRDRKRTQQELDARQKQRESVDAERARAAERSRKRANFTKW